MEHSHKPDKDYLDKLEWQLQTEYRRQSRFQENPVKKREFSFLRTAGVVMCSMFAGVVFLKAAEHVTDSWKAKLILARVETTLQLKEAQKILFKDMQADLQKRVDVGIVTKGEAELHKLSVARMDLELEKARLEVQEVQASGKAPNRELYAPKIKGVDYVSLQLKVDKKIQEQMLKMMDSQIRRMKDKVKLGLMSKEELAVIRIEKHKPQSTIEEFDYRLKLRADYLKGELSARQVVAKVKLVGAKAVLKKAEARLKSISEQAVRIKTMAKAGMVSGQELKWLDYGVQRAEAEVKMARMELEFLQNIK